jgi:transposase
VRKVGNEALAWRHGRWYGERLSTNVPEANPRLTALKRLPGFAYLSQASSVPLQQVLRIQQKVFANFFAKRARYPRLKSWTGRQCAEDPRSGFRWRDGRLHRTSTGLVRNRSLAKAIADFGWGAFRRLLEDKTTKAGKHLVVIDRWYPSFKTCSACGHLLATLGLGTRHWMCQACGTRHDRDENAAKNILAAGLAVATDGGDACGGDVRHSGSSWVQSPTKQELPAARPRIPVLQGGE